MLVMSEGPGRYCTNRVFEWFAVTVMFCSGLGILINDPIESNVIRLIVSAFYDHRVGITMMMLGGLRAAVLVINGRAQVWGPRARCILATLSAVVWGTLSVALVSASIEHHVFYTALAHYSALAVFEVIAAMRSSHDRSRRVIAIDGPIH